MGEDIHTERRGGREEGREGGRERERERERRVLTLEL